MSRDRRAKQPGRYHHGDLRRALLDAALELILERGAEGFTLRAAARAAGVSDAAPYHHFSDKEALLAELGAEGFALLSDKIRAATADLSDAREIALAMGVEYVVFAAHHPAHFRVMLSRRVLQTQHPGLAGAAMETFTLVREALLAGAARAASQLEVETLIFSAWALVHGYAFLVVEGHLGTLAEDEPRLRALIRASIMLMDAGIARS
ncbi:MAG: TetR/AcrR family transcriptional regulator [Polyangiaceae bacterium]|nr:TetR/AcrR family transcriptional regulator [Polyangiaceae bacterium]MCW5792177.1 TetR/AcrR family transcriptional regulator [Polyangiaceae bacterium]